MTVSWRAIRENIESMEKVLVTVSGGVDSMFLLDFVSRCDVEYDVAHFQHNIRDTATTDLELDIIESAIINSDATLFIGQGEGLRDIKNQECEARNQRWQFFESVIERRGIKHILTAHHLNDQIETTLMNLMRGKSHDSLSMKTSLDMGAYTKHKPLLTVPKSTIVDQATRRGIKWSEDVTNTDTHHERNWLRNDIIPQLMARRNLESSMFDSMFETLNSSKEF